MALGPSSSAPSPSPSTKSEPESRIVEVKNYILQRRPQEVHPPEGLRFSIQSGLRECRDQCRDQESQIFAEENISACTVGDVQLRKHGRQGGAFEIIGEPEYEKGKEATGR